MRKDHRTRRWLDPAGSRRDDVWHARRGGAGAARPSAGKSEDGRGTGRGAALAHHHSLEPTSRGHSTAHCLRTCWPRPSCMCSTRSPPTVSGARLKAGEMAARYIESLGGKPQATVIGTGILTSSVNAALANGMAAHGDETDDSHLRGRFHPGCGVVPAALATAEIAGPQRQRSAARGRARPTTSARGSR